TNPPGADLNVAKQRPEGWRAGKPAINGQAPNQSEARPHGRAFCVFVPIQSVRTAKQQSICLFRQHKSLPYPPHHHISLYPRSGFSVNPENHATKKNVSLITYK
ncbi:TPA: hypothetical protein ACQJMR_002043, partial [Raoultella ornithinolytica]